MDAETRLRELGFELPGYRGRLQRMAVKASGERAMLCSICARRGVRLKGKEETKEYL